MILSKVNVVEIVKIQSQKINKLPLSGKSNVIDTLFSFALGSPPTPPAG